MNKYAPVFFIAILVACTPAKKESTTAVEISGPDYVDSVNNGWIAKDTLKGSPVRELTDSIGNLQISIRYGSPGVKGRIIWGGLVTFDNVWVSGAHKATAIAFSKDVIINGTKVARGKYAFFTIPGREEWTLILNKNYEQHLADKYKPEEDIVRINVKSEKLSQPVQRLTYRVSARDAKSGLITLSWDSLSVSLPVRVSN